MKIIFRLFRKRYLVIFVATVVLFALLAQAYFALIVNRQQCMVIDFNYPGAEKGINPDGSVFEMSDLKSPEVIELAKEGLKQKEDTEFLRSRIFVTSKVSEQSLDQIVSSVRDEKNVIYMPTTFYVYYSQKNKFSKNESPEFMENLSRAYTTYFKEHYSEKNDVLEFSRSRYNFADMDYMEIYTVFKNKADTMYAYIANHQNENRAFYSEDKDNLGMAAKKIASFRDISLEKFYSYVVQNSVSRNNRQYLKRTDYIISEKTLEYDKLYEASEIARRILAEYEPGITAVTFVPSVDAKHNYYMSRTKTGLDDLTKRSYDNGMLAAQKQKEIEYYQSVYDRMAEVQSTSRMRINITDQMIDQLSKELEQISEEVLKTDNEYLTQKTKDYFKIRLPEHHVLSLSLIVKSMILGVILALFLIIGMEFFLPILKKKLFVLDRAFTNINYAKRKRGE